MTQLRALSSADKKKLARRLRRAGIDLETALPQGLSLAGDWWHNEDLVATDLNGAWGFDRGVDFEGDWIRWAWMVGPRGAMIRCGYRFVQHLFTTRATHVRWQIPLPDERAQRVWERIGAWLIAVDEPTQQAIYELRRGTHPRQRTLAGFVIAPPRLSELDRLTEWTQRPEVYRPLGYEQGPTRDGLNEYLFPAAPHSRSHLTLRFYSIRRGGRLVGLANEHDWDYFGDTVRELDVALVDLAGERSTRALVDIFAGLMHRCYADGATHTLANVREGASGRGFPRLFARIGADDITEQLRATGAGQPGRRYYVATRDGFYGSREGTRWSPT